MQNKRGLTLAYGGQLSIINIFALFMIIFYGICDAYAEKSVRIVAIGDSLTAGYGLPQGEDFPTQLEAALQAKGLNVVVDNAGVSGDTTTGGLQRLDWALGNDADFVILELGANDALRGILPEITRDNLEKILILLQEKNIPVLLTGMKAPPNMGANYTTEFDQIFPDLAEKYGADFYPFFLEDVASDPALNQSDYIHPNAEGVKIIVNNMLPYVQRFIEN
ncbi:MAG: arylesterase [Sneathiella sp.]|uniref:arylesterase n=1 Tax=Sneathiella sp. TaxID=1964365 RepID=UPI0030030151